MSQKRFFDQKIYSVVLLREGRELGNIARLCRELSWSVNRNPKIGFNKINFKIDREAFKQWCKDNDCDYQEVTTPTYTDCIIRIQNNSHHAPQDVVCGYLYDFPTLTANGDAYDYCFEFIDLAHKLTLFPPIPNGTHFQDVPVGDVINNLIQTSVDSITKYHKVPARCYDFFPIVFPNLDTKISRTYNDWKPVGEAISDMLDNDTGAGRFDFWMDYPFHAHISRFRGIDLRLEKNDPQLERDKLRIPETHLRYPAIGDDFETNWVIPLIEAPEYNQRAGVITAVYAVGSGDGDDAIKTCKEDEDAITKYGYCCSHEQYSSVVKMKTLERKAQAVIDNSINDVTVASVALNGVFIDWAYIEVGGVVTVDDVEAGIHTLGRIDTIEVNCDGNFNESVKLTLSKFDPKGCDVEFYSNAG